MSLTHSLRKSKRVRVCVSVHLGSCVSETKSSSNMNNDEFKKD